MENRSLCVQSNKAKNVRARVPVLYVYVCVRARLKQSLTVETSHFSTFQASPENQPNKTSVCVRCVLRFI